MPVDTHEDGTASLAQAYADTDVAKHYWPVLCKGGALVLADA